jgi:hypothetical protein
VNFLCIFHFSCLGSKLFRHFKRGIALMIRLPLYKRCLNTVLRKHRIISEIKRQIHFFMIILAINIFAKTNRVVESVIKVNFMIFEIIKIAF